ncbi:hypothetical protein TNCT_530991 [Trichonephila clavata]|uniref:Uncharacterized protein n=1 Tax=Trichonephila clavata TaxID=2740835 RepID=A0A8X6ICA9_TRICU|nr:hypothetical protein TNCT_530991 [Trichonephila clavata]
MKNSGKLMETHLSSTSGISNKSVDWLLAGILFWIDRLLVTQLVKGDQGKTTRHGEGLVHSSRDLSPVATLHQQNFSYFPATEEK